MKTRKHYFLLILYFCMLFALLISVSGCTNGELFAKRRETPDEQQLRIFKEQIKIKQYYYANI